MEEKDFIESLKNGDSRTFRELVDTFQLPVRNTCMGIIRNRHDAEDIAQDVFVEVFRSIQNFRSDSKLSTWIYRIAVNKSINFVNKKKREKWLSPLEDLFTGRSEHEFHASPDVLPSSDLEKQQRERNLHKALDSLPENQRIAFTLNKYEELSYQEISEVMNLSLSSVESLIHRAKVNLQRKLWNCYKNQTV